MTITRQFIEELEREAPRTRGQLENVPTGKDDWTPHPKSMPLGRLAKLVASMASWVELIINQDELDLTPPPGAGHMPQGPTSTLVEQHDGHIAKAIDALKKTNDEYLLTTNWRLKAGGHVVMNQPRYIVLRDTINHLAHHRGQLTVYLRMNDCKVAAVYGPTADDKTFA